MYYDDCAAETTMTRHKTRQQSVIILLHYPYQARRAAVPVARRPSDIFESRARLQNILLTLSKLKSKSKSKISNSTRRNRTNTHSRTIFFQPQPILKFHFKATESSSCLSGERGRPGQYPQGQAASLVRLCRSDASFSTGTICPPQFKAQLSKCHVVSKVALRLRSSIAGPGSLDKIKVIFPEPSFLTSVIVGTYAPIAKGSLIIHERYGVFFFLS